MAEEAILGFLHNNSEEITDSGQFSAEHNLDHNEVVNVIKSLHGFRYIDVQDIKRETWVLTDEGKKYAADGSPEVQLFLAVPEEGSISKDELQKKLAPSVFKIGCSQAGKNKWVEMGKQVSRKVQHVEDKVKSLLLQIQEGKDVDKDGINSLKARKLIAPQIWKGYSVKKGPNFAPERKPLATDLTRENLQNWKELALQKKHHDMLERLSARHQSLKSDSPDSSSSSSMLDSTSSFLARFAVSKRSVESRIAESRLASSSADSSKVKSDLAEISLAIDNLEKLLAENSYFLPSYEVRSSLKAVSDLKQSLEILSDKLIPKKKFSFKSKSSSRKPESKLPEIQKLNVVSPPKLPVRDSPGFRNKHGEILVKSFKGSSIGEFTLSDLDSCQVKLMRTVNALFLHRLRNCSVYTGPVIGSILIDDVEDCVLVLASHQIRIHCAKKSDFYLRVRSRPIVEDCNGVRFAPYCLDYQGIEEDLKTAGLEEETGNWANVDDFLWLRAVQSPNWSVLPEEERIASVSVSGDGDS